MKKVITAIGKEELNKRLKGIENIEILNTDIQYQEGIFEALEKYKDIDVLILSDNIIGVLETIELIKTIKIIKQNLEIVLVSRDRSKIKEDKYITKIVDDNINYVKEVIKCFQSEEDIKYSGQEKTKQEKLTQISGMPEVVDKSNKTEETKNKRYKEIKNTIHKNIITVIGNAEVR